MQEVKIYPLAINVFDEFIVRKDQNVNLLSIPLWSPSEQISIDVLQHPFSTLHRPSFNHSLLYSKIHHRSKIFIACF